MLVGPTNRQGVANPVGMLIACCRARATWAGLTGCPSLRSEGGGASSAPPASALGGAADDFTPPVVQPAIAAINATRMVRLFARLTRVIARVSSLPTALRPRCPRANLLRASA